VTTRVLARVVATSADGTAEALTGWLTIAEAYARHDAARAAGNRPIDNLGRALSIEMRQAPGGQVPLL
jgi:hypothetical protein